MLTLLVDNTRTATAAEETRRYCDILLAMRREQACEDLAYYTGRRSALAHEDPRDLTGLGELYELHVEQLTELIARIDTGLPTGRYWRSSASQGRAD